MSLSDWYAKSEDRGRIPGGFRFVDLADVITAPRDIDSIPFLLQALSAELLRGAELAGSPLEFEPEMQPAAGEDLPVGPTFEAPLLG